MKKLEHRSPKRILRTLVLAFLPVIFVVVLTVVAEDSAQVDATNCPYSWRGDSLTRMLHGTSDDPKRHRWFLCEFVNAVADNDAGALAGMARYPLLVDGQQINSPSEFLDMYAVLFPLQVREMIVSSEFEDLMIRRDGTAFGHGQIWIGEARNCPCVRCQSDLAAVAIIAISPSIAEQWATREQDTRWSVSPALLCDDLTSKI